jgi:hypothetical protein
MASSKRSIDVGFSGARQTGERLGHALAHPLDQLRPLKELVDVVDRQLAFVGLVGPPGRVLLELFVGVLEPLETGGTRDKHVLPDSLSDQHVARRESDGQLVVEKVGRRSAAAIPVGKLQKADLERLADRPNTPVVLGGHAMERTAGIVRDFHHAAPFVTWRRVSHCWRVFSNGTDV